MEQNEKFMAEGAWKPHLTPDEFYQDYVRRIFGEAAAPEALKAYQILEENEEYLGWTGQRQLPLLRRSLRNRHYPAVCRAG